MELCSLRSGSTGNAILAGTEKTKILIDCGISGKAVLSSLAELAVNPGEISAILVTHEHSDHIKGVGILARKLEIPIYASPGTWKAMYRELGKIREEWIKVFDVNGQFEIGDIGVKPFPIPHDAAQPVGYSLFGDGQKVSVATDMGEVRDEVAAALAGSATVLLEANHDVHMLEAGGYPYPLKRRVKGSLGHLSNEQAGEMARRLLEGGTTQILLGHLSRENNYPELAFQTVKNILESCGATVGKDLLLNVASRDTVSEILCAG